MTLVEKKTWDHYVKTRDRRDRDWLFEHYMPLVHQRARYMASHVPPSVSYDDICSAGYDGLLKSVESFDPTFNVKFSCFSYPKIVGAVRDYLRELDWTPRTIREFKRARLAVIQRLKNREGETPNDQEIAEGMNLPLERYRELCSQIRTEVPYSLVDPFATPENREGTLDASWDVRDVRQEDPSERLSRDSLREYALRGLSRQERLVLTLYFCDGFKFREIAKVLGVSESRICQFCHIALAKVRERFDTCPGKEQLVECH